MVKIFTSVEKALEVLQPNKPKLLLVGDIRICLVLRNNEILAVQDACSHNKESLSKGLINYRGEIACPWHGYCFDLKTGREMQERSADLKCYKVHTKDDGLFLEV